MCISLATRHKMGIQQTDNAGYAHKSDIQSIH